MKYLSFDNKLEYVRSINRLWVDVYPFLADAIMDKYNRDSGRVLEIGPFSGGITTELAKRSSKMEFSIYTWGKDVKHYIDGEIKKAKLKKRVKIYIGCSRTPEFLKQCFDLIISRGALFFLDSNLLKETYRIMCPGGLGYIGGGYGYKTPQTLIQKIHDESHWLNQQLGKNWVSKDLLENLLRDVQLSNRCQIEEKGGLWVILRK